MELLVVESVSLMLQMVNDLAVGVLSFGFLIAECFYSPCLELVEKSGVSCDEEVPHVPAETMRFGP